MARFATANDIINRTAVEVGLLPDPDPVASLTDIYIQLKGLLNSAGQELVEMQAWQGLLAAYNFTVVDGDSGTYNLPDDFSAMVDQSGWDLANQLPIAGPLSVQEWALLIGRNLVNQTIYSSFRLVDNQFELFPAPPAAGMQVSFQYISRNWVLTADIPGIRQDTVTLGSNIVLYEPILAIKFLKVKFLDSKGFDSTAARLDFDNILTGRMGRDTGAPVLNAGGNRAYPYLNINRNVPFTGFGL